MDFFRNLGIGMTLCSFLFGITTACVNHISETEEEGVDDMTLPLKFAADIQGIGNTRMNGDTFDKADTVGLFALATTTGLKEERYVNNQCFVRSADGEFISDELTYYPGDGVKLNLISYYPYQESGMAMGESVMQVMVEPEQNIPANYSHSDFLVAYKTDVAATKEVVPLTYKHKFFKLKVALAPAEGENADNLLIANPQLSISGFFTKTKYDFQEESYSEYSEEKDIIPGGEWKVEDGRLVGKQFILIPQETTDGYQCITLEVNGEVYNTLLPSTLKLQNGKQRELEITFKSDEKVLISRMNGEIDGWEEAGTDKVESEAVRKYIDISKLTFEESSVYKIMHVGRQVAEICKEYLVTPNFSSQAIVVYPVKKDDHTVDLSAGTVVQLLGQTDKVQGGHVSWNTVSHTLIYTPGTSAMRNYVYVLPDGQISLSASMVDEALPVSACSDVVRDARGRQVHNYPIVKIATQYWMRTNLEAKQYLNGAAISRLETMGENGTGYLLSDIGNYYYSASAVLDQSLSPMGWELPNWKDWEELKQYLKNDASLLKSGSWIPIITDKVPSIVTTVNNFSGFNATPVGMYIQTFLPSAYEGKYVSYWTLNADKSAIDAKSFTLKSDSNEIMQGNSEGNKAYVIRCIRK